MDRDFRKLIGRKVVLFDGGMGSMLIAAGLKEGEAPERWILTESEQVMGIHTAYVEAGAEVIQTNTFGANRIKLSSSRSGSSLDVAEVNLKGVELARRALEAAGHVDRFVAGEIGPTGQFFPPVGTLTAGEVRNAFREQARVLGHGGVDLFLVETMYDLREGLEALRAVREVSDKPVVVEFTFEKKPKGYFTLMGVTPRQVVEALLAEGADAVGANCSISSGEMVDLVFEFRSLTEAPILFQPNAGNPVMEHGIAIYKQRPEEFAGDIWKMVEAGANAVGGCCGTTPRFISEIHERLTHG